MGLLDSEAGKRRLLSVEIPVIERYNEGRDPLQDPGHAPGQHLVLRYRLKPGHNVYQLETRLVSSYPTVPPETRVLTPLKHCPHLLEGQTLCLWRQGSTRADQPLGSVPVHLYLRRSGRLALAGLLRNLARNRGMAAAGSEVGFIARSRCDESLLRVGLHFNLQRNCINRRNMWRTCSRSAQAAAACRSSTCSAGTRASPGSP